MVYPLLSHPFFLNCELQLKRSFNKSYSLYESALLHTETPFNKGPGGIH